MAETAQNLGLDASDYFDKVAAIIQKNRDWEKSVKNLADEHKASVGEISKAVNDLAKVVNAEIAIQEKLNAVRAKGILLAQQEADANRRQGRVFGGRAPQTAQGTTPTSFAQPDPNANRALRENADLVNDLNARLEQNVRIEKTRRDLTLAMGSEADRLQKLAIQTSEETRTRVAARLSAETQLHAKLTDAKVQGALQFAEAEKKAAEQTARANEQANGLLLSWRSIIRIVSAQLIHTAIGGFISEMRQAVEASREFQIKVSEIRTISQGSQRNFDDWSASIRTLSDEFGKPILDVAAGTYEAISNQIAKGAEVSDFMAKALRFAQVAVTSTENSVNLLSSVINAYGLSVQEADRVSAQLFKTIDLGRVRADDLANTYGRILPLAAQLGVQLEETNAAVAAITIVGIKPAEALTAINGIMNQLLKPTDELKGLFKEWGVTTGQAAIQAFGFQGVLHKLLTAIESGRVTFEGVVDEIRARRGLTPLIRSLEQYDSILTKIKDGSQAEFLQASKDINESAGIEFTKQLNRIQNIFTADFGKPFIDSLLKIGAAFGSITGQTNDLVGGFRGLLTVLNTGAITWVTYRLATGGTLIGLGSIKLAVTGLIPRLTALTGTLRGGTTAWINWTTAAHLAKTSLAGLALPAAILGVAFAWQKTSEFADEAARAFEENEEKIREAVNKTTEALGQALDRQNQAFRNNLDERYKGYAQSLAKTNQALIRFSEEEVKQAKRVSKALQDAFDVFAKGLSSAISNLEKQSATAISNIEKAQETLFSLQENLTQGRFDKQIGILPEPAQVEALFKRINELQQASTKKLLEKAPTSEIAAKNREESEKMAKEAERLYNKILEIDNKTTEKRKDAVDKLQEANTKVGANRSIREDKENLADMARQQAALNALRKKGDVQGLAFAKIALQEELKRSQEAEASRKEDLSTDKLEAQIKAYDAIKQKIGERAAVEAQIESFHEKQIAALEQYIILNNQLAATAESKKEAEQKRLEALKTNFAEIAKFKLPEEFDPKKFQDAFKEFDTLVAKTPVTDESVIAALAEKRVSLEKEANIAIAEHYQKQREQGLQAEKEKQIKNNQEASDRVLTLSKSKATSLETIPKILEQMAKFGNSQVWTRAVGAGRFEDTTVFKELLETFRVFRENQTNENAEAFRIALEPVITKLVKQDANTLNLLKFPFTQRFPGDQGPEDLVIKKGSGKSPDKTLQDLIQVINQSITDVQNTNKKIFEDQKKSGVDVGEAMARATGSVERFTIALENATASLGGPKVEHKMFGWYARGPDRIPAMLSPGEFVVRASQARKYYDLLNRMNSGLPLYFNEGGVVPATYNFERRINQSSSVVNDFGGITVHVSAAGGPVDPVAIARGIKAAIRRGEVSL